VRRSNRWLVRDELTRGPVTRRFRYGTVTDRPVPGDWDGDGRTGAGVVRHQTFYLRNPVGGGKVSAILPFAG
jgi:hypothetical protein